MFSVLPGGKGTREVTSWACSSRSLGSPPSPFQAGQTLCLTCWVCVGWAVLPHPRACVAPLPPRSSSRDPVTPAQLFLELGLGGAECVPRASRPGAPLPRTGGGQDLSSVFLRKAGPGAPSDLRKVTPTRTLHGEHPLMGQALPREPQPMRSEGDERAESLLSGSVSPTTKQRATSPAGPRAFSIQN